MRVNSNFVLKKLGDMSVIIPVGQKAVDMNSILNLNETGLLLYEGLVNNLDNEALIKLLMEEYDISQNEASLDVLEFVNKLIELGVVNG